MLRYRSKACGRARGIDRAVATVPALGGDELFEAGVVQHAALPRSPMLQRRQRYSTRVFHEW